MSQHEEYFVLGTSLYTRYNLAQILYAQSLRDGEEQPSCLDKACYQLQGGVTALHDFATNLEKLSVLLALYEKSDKRCLAQILLEDAQGLTPLDLALRNDRAKCIELMLQKLTMLPDLKLSKQFYTKFAMFFMRDSKAFYKYLDTCFFQTTQMLNNTKMLLKSSEDPLIIAHNSCILDLQFRDEHTNPPKQIVNDYKKQISRINTMYQDFYSSAHITGLKNYNDQHLEETEKERIVEIKVVEFDWVLSGPHADHFMKSVSECESTDIFSLLTV